MSGRAYLCIDLKSFYASVECVERGLNPMTAKLAVADPERGKGTICLAISPAMKALGIPNRCRVYQIPKNVEYIMAPPRMKLYIEYSADIYAIYLKYIAKEDIHVYSIDEAFIDVTDYLGMYEMSAKELALCIMEDIKYSTGITATAGIGTNLYLAKVALDILAKHNNDNIAYLDEELYRKKMWNHKPIKDFWRVGKGVAKRLSKIGIMTMGDVAKADEKVLYKIFGVDAELLIDHAWGRESTTMADIKSYKPKSKSLSSSQVLLRDYGYEEGMLILKEMTDSLCLDMLERGLVTESLSVNIGYSFEYGHDSSTGTQQMTVCTNLYDFIIPYAVNLYERIADKNIPIRKISITFNNVMDELYEQYDLFTNPINAGNEKNLQRAVLNIKNRFGKNAVLRGRDLLEQGTAIERNRQIGGHRSGE